MTMQIPLTASDLRHLAGYLNEMAEQGDKLLGGLSVMKRDRKAGGQEITEALETLIRLGLSHEALAEFSSACQRGDA